MPKKQKQKNKIVQFSSIIDGVQKKKDGTLSIKLGSQELSPQDTALIFDLGNKQIWTALAETELTKEDIIIPDEVIEFKNDKSSSQRLRNIIFVYWKEKTAQTKTFDEFYKGYINKIIENIKDKLD